MSVQMYVAPSGRCQVRDRYTAEKQRDPTRRVPARILIAIKHLEFEALVGRRRHVGLDGGLDYVIFSPLAGEDEAVQTFRLRFWRDLEHRDVLLLTLARVRTRADGQTVHHEGRFADLQDTREAREAVATYKATFFTSSISASTLEVDEEPRGES